MNASLRLVLSALLVTWASLPAAATSPQTSPVPRQRDADSAHRYFTDVVLVDHDGQSRRLYSDLLRERVVIVSSFFTSCGDSCPIIMGKLARVQDALGDRLGRDVSILSLTVDPATDTAERLNQYATRFGVRPGWYLLTGEPANVRLALRKLGHATQTKDAHLSLLIMGNERTGLWKKVLALAAPDELVRLVLGVLEDR